MKPKNLRKEKPMKTQVNPKNRKHAARVRRASTKPTSADMLPMTESRFKMLEADTKRQALDGAMAEARDGVTQWLNFFTQNYWLEMKRHLENRELALQRSLALERAQQIAGVMLDDFIWQARTSVAAQLRREMDTPGARQIAALIEDVNLWDYKSDVKPESF